MEDSNEEHRVVPELYFLIAKFLSSGPLKETAKTLLKELESVEVLPRRLDWEGNEHTQSYHELSSQYRDMSPRRLAAVCARALQLARAAGEGPPGPRAPGPGGPALRPGDSTGPRRLAARLSLLSEKLVRNPSLYGSKQDHTLVRRLVSRELGWAAGAAGAGGGVFPARMLAGLSLQRRTLGHLSAVYCLVFDCAGRVVLTGADDLLVKVWSAADGRLLATLRGAGAEITDVCVSADGALVAVGSVERLVRVWCLATAAPRAVLHAHAGTITSVHWAPPARTDVRWLASTSTDGSVAFWTCSPDGQFLSQPVQYVERMRPGACHMICAAWSSGGAFLAAGSADHHVRLYTVEHEPGGPRRVLETAVHSDAVDSIAWAHRGLRFVSGSKDGSAALWTLHATQWRHVLLLPTADNQNTDQKRLKVTMVCWDRSDEYILTAVSDKTIRVWCGRTCSQVCVLRGHRDEAYVLEAHPFLPGVVLSAGHDGQLFVWHALQHQPLASFHNKIDGQGDGAIFDAKWGGGCLLAASDSHGHLLLLSLGGGDPLLKTLPTELFFHTDYRPLARDALGGALDEQTDTPPHLMPPPFLVDVEGAPHPPHLQRLVPGREHLSLSQLVPAAEARSRIDRMIEVLAGERSPPAEGRGVWRGEGVRHTLGSWQAGDPLLVPPPAAPLVAPLPRSHTLHMEQTAFELNAMEQSWYRREMRRRPVMISTAPEGAGRRRPPRPAPRAPGPRPAPRAPGPRPAPRAPRPAPRAPPSPSEESLSMSPPHDDRSDRSSLDLTDTTSSSSSQYSDWEAGAALAPPARARRRPLPANRYSPSTQPKRTERPTASTSTAAASNAVAGASGDDPGASVDGPGASVDGPGASVGPSGGELPDVYRPGEWLTAVTPRKAPYHPQMGDQCLYFRVGHQRYLEAVAEKDLYKILPRDKPWERTHVYECEMVKVVGIKYVIKPPRVVCLRLACSWGEGEGQGGEGRSFTVRYHDMPDVIDFLVLRQHYEAATARRWGPGDRFRCMIDDSWWTGVVVERISPPPPPSPPGHSPPSPRSPPPPPAAATEAASHFLSLRVRWDNGEVERLSPWDLEPIDPDRLPAEPGGCVPVLAPELEAVLYRAEPHEWPPRGDRPLACRTIAQHIGQVMSLAVAEPFVAPVDLQLYPSYARVVPYPIDLATIRARFDNLFYRRAAAAQFDVRYLASNAEQFNEPHSTIVRQARLLTDLLLHTIARWRDVDVLAVYHRLTAAYQSSEEEPPREGGWRGACARVLRQLAASNDAEPFRTPVSPDQAPDYRAVVSRPMDLGSIRTRLSSGHYSKADQFAADVRLVFSNSRLYNTNKRSRIYSMTVRLSALFEALWSRLGPRPRARLGPRPRARPQRRTRARRDHTAGGVSGVNGVGRAGPVGGAGGSSSDSEPLAATSRRVHAARPRADSWDSDAPLLPSNKGKGVGKKSKTSTWSAEEPGPSRTRTRDASLSGEQSAASSSGSPYSIRVLEEELPADEVELTYTDSDHQEWERPRKRRVSDSSGSHGPHRRRPPKRTRERISACWKSSSASSSASGASLDAEAEGRYESDRSYRPHHESDDDAPLHLYRQRQEVSEEAGPSNGRRERHSHRSGRSGGVSLRARRSPRRYNEDSDEDSAAAISKRLHHHRPRPPPHPPHPPHPLPTLTAQTVSRAHTSDHNYFNGHAHAHDTEPRDTNAVSISSRGRVRKLTAKARGLLRE